MTWNNFQLVKFDDFLLSRSNNIYFAIVKVFTVATSNAERFVAVFPAILDGLGAGIFVAFSDDGISFTKPERILESMALEGGRTSDHPIDIEIGASRGRGKTS